MSWIVVEVLGLEIKGTCISPRFKKHATLSVSPSVRYKLASILQEMDSFVCNNKGERVQVLYFWPLWVLQVRWRLSGNFLYPNKSREELGSTRLFKGYFLMLFWFHEFMPVVEHVLIGIYGRDYFYRNVFPWRF